jgi:hypothetical protein
MLSSSTKKPTRISQATKRTNSTQSQGHKLDTNALSDSTAMLRALERALEPLARLMMSRGILYPALDGVLQRAYLSAAIRYFCDAKENTTASKLYLLTGIHRKKIVPLRTTLNTQPDDQSRSLSARVSELFSTDVRLLAANGKPKPIHLRRRDGGELSFEALVESISKDVRPRAIMNQLIASRFASIDSKGMVNLNFNVISDQSGLVSMEQALRPLLEAISHNLLKDGTRNLNAMVFVDGLSRETAEQEKAKVHADMTAYLIKLNKRLEQAAVRDTKAGKGDSKIALGAYAFCEPDVKSDTLAPSTQPRTAIMSATHKVRAKTRKKV